MASGGAYIGNSEEGPGRKGSVIEWVSKSGYTTTGYRFANGDVPTAMAFNSDAMMLVVGTAIGV